MSQEFLDNLDLDMKTFDHLIRYFEMLIYNIEIKKQKPDKIILHLRKQVKELQKRKEEINEFKEITK